MISCDFALPRLGNALWPLSGCIRWCEGPHRFHTSTQCQNIIMKHHRRPPAVVVPSLSSAEKEPEMTLQPAFRGGPLRNTNTDITNILVTMVTIITITYQIFTSSTEQPLVLLSAFVHNWICIDLASVTLLSKSDPHCVLLFQNKTVIHSQTPFLHRWFGSRPNTALVLKHLP